MGILTFIGIHALVVLVFVLVIHHNFHEKYTLGEMIAQFILTVLIISVTYFVTRNYDLYDYMFVNGKVTDKYSRQYTCNNYGRWSDYPDSSCSNERTRTKSYGCSKTRKVGKVTTSYRGTCYKTQYTSIYPWEKSWFIVSNVGRYTIKREDSQGAVEPNRYNITNKGDPVTSTVGYYNYIKAAKNSLFASKIDNEMTPFDREGIYDYYKINNVYTHGDVSVNKEILSQINEKLSVLNSDLTNSANLVMVFAETDIMEYVKSSWEGFKLNDFVILFIVEEGKIKKVKTFSWSKSSIVNIEVSDYFNVTNTNSDLSILQDAKTFGFLKSTIVKSYQKPEETDFEYLENDIHISTKAHLLIIMLNILLSAILTIVFIKNEVL